MYDPFKDLQSFTIESGVTVHLLQVPNVPWIYFEFIFQGVGGKLDDKFEQGTAHFVEHMINANSPVTTTAMQHIFNKVGGYVSLGNTSMNHTSYGCKVPYKRSSFEPRIQLLGTYLLENSFWHRLEHERQVILGEYQSSFGTSGKYEFEIFKKRILAGNRWWYGKQLRAIGTPDTIRKIDGQIIRSFYENYYLPQNLHIVVVGNIKHNDLVNVLADSAFGVKKTGKKLHKERAIKTTKPLVGKTVQIEIKKQFDHNTTNGVVQWQVLTPTGRKPSASQIGMQLLDALLYASLRDKHHLTYGPEIKTIGYIAFDEHLVSSGSISPSKIDLVQQLMEESLEKAIENQHYLEREIKTQIAKLKMKDFNGHGLASWIVDDVLSCRTPQKISDQIEELKSITYDDVRSFLINLLPDKRVTFVIRP